jgi:hypothetical protein
MIGKSIYHFWKKQNMTSVTPYLMAKAPKRIKAGGDPALIRKHIFSYNAQIAKLIGCNGIFTSIGIDGEPILLAAPSRKH